MKHASSEMKGDTDIVRAAVRTSGLALAFAAVELTTCRDIVMEAVRHNPMPLQFAAWNMRTDRDVVLTAAMGNIGCLKHTDPQMARAVRRFLKP